MKYFIKYSKSTANEAEEPT